MTIFLNIIQKLTVALQCAVIFSILAGSAIADTKEGEFIDPQHKAEHVRLEAALEKLESARKELEKERAETEAFAKRVLAEIQKAKAAEAKPPMDTKALEAKERQIDELEKELNACAKHANGMAKRIVELESTLKGANAGLRNMDQLKSELATCMESRKKSEQRLKALEGQLASEKAKIDAANAERADLQKNLKKAQEGHAKAIVKTVDLIEDAKAHQKKLDEAVSNLKGAEKKLADAQGAMDAASKNAETLEMEKGRLIEEMNGLRNIEKEMDVLRASLEKMKGNEEEMSALRKAEAEFAALQSEHAVAKESQKKLTVELEQCRKAEASQKKAHVDLQKELDALKAAKTKMKGNSEELAKLRSKEAALNKSLQEVTANSEKLTTELEHLKAESAKSMEISKRWDEEKADFVATNKELAAVLETFKGRIKSAEDLSAKARGELVKEKVARQKLERQIELMQVPAVKPIYFGLSDSEAQKQQARVLAEVNDLLKRFPELKFHVVGHTCNQGSDAANLELSTRRAKTLADYLIANGIATEKVSFEGKGETLPVNDNSSEALRQLNRRVEVWLSN